MTGEEDLRYCPQEEKRVATGKKFNWIAFILWLFTFWGAIGYLIYHFWNKDETICVHCGTDTLEQAPSEVSDSLDEPPFSNQEHRYIIQRLANEKLGNPTGATQEALDTVPDVLDSNEEVLNLAAGHYDGKGGVVLLTDQRVIFYTDPSEASLMSSSLEDFPFEAISSVETGEGGLSGGTLEVHGRGNTAEISLVRPEGEATEIGDYLRQVARESREERLDAGQDDSRKREEELEDAQADDIESVVDKLERLKKLHDDGAISDEEFETLKSELVDS